MNRVMAVAVVLLLTSQDAQAVPTLLTNHGYLTYAGSPVEGIVLLTFRLYDGQSAGSAFWEESVEVNTTAGYYSATLGQTSALAASDLAAISDPWLGLAVSGGSELVPRLAVTSVPFSMAAERASTAESIDCEGCIGAPHVSIPYARSASKGGPAVALECEAACVDTSELTNGAVTSPKIAIPLTTGALYVNADQVGVGTTTPGATFDVAGDITAASVAAPTMTGNVVGTLNGVRMAAGGQTFSSGSCGGTVTAPCTIDISAGNFSAAPTCVITMVASDATGYTENMVIKTVSATALQIWKGNYQNEGTTMRVRWVCVGG